PVHWVSHLYGNLPKARLVATHTHGETFDADLKGVAHGTHFPLIDAIAVLSDDQEAVILLMINRHPVESRDVEIELVDFEPLEQGELQSISGADYMVQNTLANTKAVQIETETVAIAGAQFTLSLLPHSVNALTLKRVPKG
ncbi:MAG: alpha-L-arabinofuranosidase C-terminal domain-containing protein, partial [Candidatus Latescibacterota bacterium]